MSGEAVYVNPDMPVCLAWTAEQMLIKYFRNINPLQTLNKKSTFGLGRLPDEAFSEDFRYTLTLVRGVNRNTRYNAYPLVTDAVKNANGDYQTAIANLKALEEYGKLAEERLCNFTDYIISTWNPHLAWDPEHPNERMPKIEPPPMQDLPEKWISEREYYNSMYKMDDDTTKPQFKM